MKGCIGIFEKNSSRKIVKRKNREDKGKDKCIEIASHKRSTGKQHQKRFLNTKFFSKSFMTNKLGREFTSSRNDKCVMDGLDHIK